MAFSRPAVTMLCMDLCMARRTQRHQVFVPVVTAHKAGVHSYSGHGCVSMPSVLTLSCWIAIVLLISLVFQFLMLLAEPVVRQFRTAGVGTWPL